MQFQNTIISHARRVLGGLRWRSSLHLSVQWASNMQGQCRKVGPRVQSVYKSTTIRRNPEDERELGTLPSAPAQWKTRACFPMCSRTLEIPECFAESAPGINEWHMRRRGSSTARILSRTTRAQRRVGLSNLGFRLSRLVGLKPSQERRQPPKPTCMTSTHSGLSMHGSRVYVSRVCAL